MTTNTKPSALEAATKYNAVLASIHKMEQNILRLILADHQHEHLPTAAEKYRKAVALAEAVRQQLMEQYPALRVGKGLRSARPSV
jgi:hypothetical protein